MESQSKIDLAYIAGFLDGDGSLMLQIKKRKDGNKKFRFMSTVCFYQDSHHDKPLYWIREILGIGYISRRNDGMTELRINGFKQIRNIISNLLPFIKFKENQAKAMLKANNLLLGKITKRELLKLANLMLEIQNNNYKSRNRKTKQELLKILDLTP